MNNQAFLFVLFKILQMFALFLQKKLVIDDTIRKTIPGNVGSDIVRQFCHEMVAIL